MVGTFSIYLTDLEQHTKNIFSDAIGPRHASNCPLNLVSVEEDDQVGSVSLQT